MSNHLRQPIYHDDGVRGHTEYAPSKSGYAFSAAEELANTPGMNLGSCATSPTVPATAVEPYVAPASKGGGKDEVSRRTKEQYVQSEFSSSPTDVLPFGHSSGPQGWKPQPNPSRRRRATLGLFSVMSETLQKLGATPELLECFKAATLTRIEPAALRAEVQAILLATKSERSAS